MEKAIQGIESTAQILKGSNELIPTKNPNKCRVCEYLVLCKWRADTPEYQPPYFLDIETNLEGTLVWCIGIFDPIEARFTQFFLETEVDELSILRDTIRLLSRRPSSRIMSFSASAFDKRIIRKRLEANNLDIGISKRIVDLHPILRTRLGEKVLGRFKEFSSKYGYEFIYDDMDGEEAALLYEEYKSSKKQSIKIKLLNYNKDDAMALVYLAMKIPDAFDFKRSQFARAPPHMLIGPLAGGDDVDPEAVPLRHGVVYAPVHEVSEVSFEHGALGRGVYGPADPLVG